MAISESQLETWAKQGSVTQSSATYGTVRRVLEDANALFANRSFEIFLQGSYGNDTNVWKESDVDVVINLTDIYYYDLESLTPDDRERFNKDTSSAGYTVKDFKASVSGWLEDRFGDEVDLNGDKAIAIAANGSRRDADVIVSANYRKYTSYSPGNIRFHPGICFFTKDSTQIVNYPKMHSANMTTKHQATNGWLKPMARIFKNLRNRMVDSDDIENGLAPSYYLEGLLYNVPNDKFGGSYVDTFVNVFNYLHNTDRSKFLCANERYYLFHPTSQVTWRVEKCEKFLDAVRQAWTNWP
jgi:hypothetical protein